MTKKFNLIVELEEKIKGILVTKNIEKGKLGRKKRRAKAFSLTRAETSPNLCFKNKSPENYNEITNEISLIKNSIVEEDRRRSIFCP